MKDTQSGGLLQDGDEPDYELDPAEVQEASGHPDQADGNEPPPEAADLDGEEIPEDLDEEIALDSEDEDKALAGRVADGDVHEPAGEEV